MSESSARFTVLERRIDRAVKLHTNHQTCKEHGLTDHDCGGPVLFRCWVCVAPASNRPCSTWRVLTGADE